MAAAKQHWITALSLAAAAFMLLGSVHFLVFPTGGDHTAGFFAYGVVSALAALALLAGLWGLRSGQVGSRAAHALIVAGFVVLAAAYWWFVLVPLIVALVLLYAGVLKRGLARELRAS